MRNLSTFACIWFMICYCRNVSVAMDKMQHFTSERKETVSDTDNAADVYEQFEKCKWFKACICRDESYYTNSTYMLMVNCTQAGLKDVPQNIPNTTTVLTLDNNNITDIKPGAFKELTDLKYLDISNNNLKQLRHGVFEGLKNLHTLELSGNKIRYNSKAIPAHVFKPLEKLGRLNLHQNLDGISSDEKYPATSIANLNQLHQLLIDGLQAEDFGYTFATMTNLTTLELSSSCGRCNFSTVNVDMFRNLKRITSLKLSNCNIKHVESGSFSELKNLKNLDLSYNEQLHFRYLPNITIGLQTQHLKELKLSKIHETFGDCTRLEKEHLIYLKHMDIDDLFLDANRLAYITEEAVDFIPRKIQKLSLTNNMLLAGEYVHRVFDGAVFENLNHLTLAEQTMNYDPMAFFNNKTKEMLQSVYNRTAENYLAKQHYLEQNTSMNINVHILPNTLCANCQGKGLNNDIILHFPQSLKDVDFSGLRIRNTLKNICICEPNSLLRMNLERNIFWSWQGPITGLSKLLDLNLAWNSCDTLSFDVFDGFTSLIKLNLSRNFIERFLRKDTEGRIFRELKSLRFLVLADIKLRYLPQKIFSGLRSIQRIDLSDNFLTQIDLTFDHTVPLQELNLSHNLLNKIGKNIMDILDAVANLKPIYYYSYIDLSGNNLSCTCKDRNFVDWVSVTTVRFIQLDDYMCKYENGISTKLKFAEEISKRLKKDCADYTVLTICASLGFVLFLAIIILCIIYRYRWDLRYFYYSMKLRMNRKGLLLHPDDDDGEFTHDVFISYANENGTFIKNDLIPELEDKRQLRLLVHDRDFELGEFVSDNIVRAISTSRKTLITMSRHFLASDWCIFEMNMARMEAIKTGRNVLCLIMLEEVPMEGLPLEILDIIRHQTYLELPSDIDHRELFWERVHNALMN
ncbi:toll-like receptor 4 [Mercenaria mercenaria]|uniref:toll-like receptor 4 n=1 Tax=Mercenaria mercenaria TaxID=6596 RepID=UPI00234F44F6|nr:toll-like receptor 4 [Mercenaria mercenaria]